MSRLLSTRLTVSLAAAAVAVTALAAPAFAVDPTPAQNAMLLQASDLPSSYGTPTDQSFTNVQKGAELGDACFTATGDAPGTTVADQLNMFSEIDYSSGLNWIQDIYVYASKAKAAKAFTQMTTKAVPMCQGTDTTTKGDDNVPMPPRTTTVTAKVTNGVIVATLKATSKPGAKARYADSYSRRLTARVGTGIEALQLNSTKPITAAQKRTQDSTFANLLARYNG